MSGNGRYQPHNGSAIPPIENPVVVVPPANGSGCITSGPFKDVTVNLGPIEPAYPDAPRNPMQNGLGYNPRCIRRDISNWVGRTAMTDSLTADLIAQSKNVLSFQDTMQGGILQGLPILGVHAGGHWIIGGEPGGDFFASTG